MQRASLAHRVRDFDKDVTLLFQSDPEINELKPGQLVFVMCRMCLDAFKIRSALHEGLASVERALGEPVTADDLLLQNAVLPLVRAQGELRILFFYFGEVLYRFERCRDFTQRKVSFYGRELNLSCAVFYISRTGLADVFRDTSRVDSCPLNDYVINVYKRKRAAQIRHHHTESSRIVCLQVAAVLGLAGCLVSLVWLRRVR
jgi:hypothetical protein